jgi:hypothetical protein
MSLSSVWNWITGFWEYFWLYPEAHLSVYRAATAIAAAFGLLMYFDPLFSLPAVAAYLLPPMYLYHAEDDPGSASVWETSETDNTDTDFDGRDIDIDTDGDDFDADVDGSDADADADGADADADGSDADADADGADVDIDN